MSLDAQSILKRRRFDELMQAGREAYRQGKRRLAHDHWREAATVDPYKEEVWLSLYRVLENEEDRIVCLENIIAINPMNVQARRRLRDYREGATPTAQRVVAAPAKTPRKAGGRKPVSKSKTAQPSRRAKAQPSSGGRLRGVLIALVVVALVVLLALALAGAFTPR